MILLGANVISEAINRNRIHQSGAGLMRSRSRQQDATDRE